MRLGFCHFYPEQTDRHYFGPARLGLLLYRPLLRLFQGLTPYFRDLKKIRVNRRFFFTKTRVLNPEPRLLITSFLHCLQKLN